MVEPITISLSVAGAVSLIIAIIARLCKNNRFNCSSECCDGNCKASIKNMFRRNKKD